MILQIPYQKVSAFRSDHLRAFFSFFFVYSCTVIFFHMIMLFFKPVCQTWEHITPSKHHHNNTGIPILSVPAGFFILWGNNEFREKAASCYTQQQHISPQPSPFYMPDVFYGISLKNQHSFPNCAVLSVAFCWRARRCRAPASTARPCYLTSVNLSSFGLL